MLTMNLSMLKHTCTHTRAHRYTCFQVHRSSGGIKGVTVRKRASFSQFIAFCTILITSPLFLLINKEYVGFRKVAISAFFEKPYVLVSLASLCMISKIILQAEEQPSGVE